MIEKIISKSNQRTTALVLRGTFIAIVCLGTLLVLYNGIFRSIWLEGQTWFITLIFLYLFLAEALLRKGYETVVNYMLIAFYISVSFCTLLLCGLNAPVGILTVSFAVLLPSILIGSKSIMPVAGISILSLVIIETLHNIGLVSPDLQNLSLESTYWDVATYSTILLVFALVSWLAGTQREKNLQRALSAEAKLRAQKDILAVELEKESSALRLAQLNEIRHLHKFALLGQSTAATLHDLSNHLSILNLDIDDLSQQSSNSKAIDNARDSIKHINKMVKQARIQLNSYDNQEFFNILDVINQSINDVSIRYKHHAINLNMNVVGSRRSYRTFGSPMALTQIIIILLNNALEASRNNLNPQVTIEVKSEPKKLSVSVLDNGLGIEAERINNLFKPVKSSKPNGLGVGLYIAKHLTKEQFDGSIQFKKSAVGAHFLITIPKRKR